MFHGLQSSNPVSRGCYPQVSLLACFPDWPPLAGVEVGVTIILEMLMPRNIVNTGEEKPNPAGMTARS